MSLARHQRALAVSVAVAVIAAATWLLWPAQDGERPVAPPSIGSSEDSAVENAVRVAMPARGTDDPADAASRAEVDRPAVTPTEDAPRRPGIFFVDSETDQPLLGVRVFDLRGKKLFARSDADGRVDVDPAKLSAYGIAPNDRHYPCLGALAQSRAEYLPDGSLQLPLVTDLSSVRIMFRFVDRDEKPVAGVRFVVAPTSELQPAGEGDDWRGFVRAVSMMPELSAAWVQPSTPPRSFRADADGEAFVRFGRTGEFEVRGSAPSADGGMSFIAGFSVLPGKNRRVEVRADTAMNLSGVVVSGRDGQPVSGAKLRAGDRSEATTDENGRFTMGPFASPVALSVEAYGHERWTAEDVPIEGGHSIELVSLPQRWIEVELRSAADQSLIEEDGAVVELLFSERVVETVACVRGRATIATATSADSLLRMRAPSWSDYAVLVGRRCPKVVCSMLPKSLDQQRKSGLIGTVRGTLRDAEGQPIPDAELQLSPPAAVRYPAIDNNLGFGGIGAFSNLVGEESSLVIESGMPLSSQFKCETDASGRFEFSSTHEEPHEAYLLRRAEGGQLLWLPCGSATVELGAVSEKDLVLPASGR